MSTELEGAVERITDLDFKFSLNHEPETLQHQSRLSDIRVKERMRQINMDFELRHHSELKYKEQTRREVAMKLTDPVMLAAQINCWESYKRRGNRDLPGFLLKR